MKYQGEIRYIREKEKFALFLPVEQMQELYVLVLFEIDDNNTLKMKAPSLHYTDDLEKGITMSFYYLSAISEMVIDRDVNHKDSKDVYAAIRYSSVTDHSLVIELSNATEKELSLPKEYKIYKYSEDGEDKDKVYEGTLKNIDEKILGTSMYSLEIEFDEQLAEGTYMIEYGMNKENCVYETLDFTIDKGVVKK